MIGVYKITNNINGKSYIGQSKHIKRRWREHIGGLENSVIGNAIKKYGQGNFTFEILETCLIEELNDKEVYYINKFETFGNGYNMTTGGDGVKGVGKVLTPERIPEILNHLRRGIPTSEIAEQFKVCAEMINRINHGNAWRIEGESYPIRRSASEKIIEKMDKDMLLETIATLGFKGAGDAHGMTGNGIKARCEILGLPTKIKEIKEMYGLKERLIEATHNKKTIDVGTIEELVDYIVENKLTTASREFIKASIRRVLNGSRKTYLGITIKEITML